LLLGVGLAVTLAAYLLDLYRVGTLVVVLRRLI
jgi:hypothetical protein